MFRKSMFFAIAVSVLLASQVAAQVAGVELEISLERNSDAEKQRAEELGRIMKKYPVEAWIWTRKVHIDERSIPHSHPVLTLHTRGDEHELLSTFLHEQFHWLEAGNDDFRAAMRSFEQAYPGAPSGPPEGARDLESTYRHLLVCDLELQAMSQMVGVERARQVLAAKRYYTWVYDRVLNDPKVREIAREHGFILGGAGASSRGIAAAPPVKSRAEVPVGSLR